jgi:hypothetical protein
VKQKVIEIVQAALANSENELYELKKEFMNLDMGSEYCDSGLTCQEFLDVYEIECKTLWKCLQWVKNAKRKKKGASY